MVRLCGTRDPIRIAKEIGVHVMYNNDFTTLKGMYKVIQRSRFIILNGNLEDRELKTVCAHELGHDRFHRELAKSSALQEFTLYNTLSDLRYRHEYEANIFASNVLIDDEEIMEMIYGDCSLEGIAGELDEDVNLVLIKMEGLNERGYKVRAPYHPQSDFLGRN